MIIEGGISQVYAYQNGPSHDYTGPANEMNSITSRDPFGDNAVHAKTDKEIDKKGENEPGISVHD